MAVIGKTAQDKGTKELSVGKLTQKRNPVRDHGTELTVKSDGLNFTDLTDGTTNRRQRTIVWEIYKLTLLEYEVKAGTQRR